MTQSLRSTALAALLAVATLGTVAHAQDAMAGMHMPGHIMIPKGANIVVADVEFMQGMIAHHAQAIYMSRLAAAHGANAKVLKLATKIDQSQVAEIVIMQDWLRRYQQAVPDTSSWHTMQMAGMLSTEQIEKLNAAKGVDFDRAFLQYMIQHHQGALQMVKDLFAAPRGGQEVDVGVFANDVVAVQTAEIGVMQQMLAMLPARSPAR